MFGLAKKLGPIGAVATLLASAALPSMHRPAHAAGALLTVYTHLNPPEAQVIRLLSRGFTAKTGVSVKVVVDTGNFQSFAQLAHSGHGPDVMFGLPDDNTGTFHAARLLDKVPAGTFNPSDYVTAAQQATVFKDGTYSVPLMLDTYTLVYNKKLVPTPPKDFNELVQTSRKFPNTSGKNYGFLFDPTNFYFSYAFIRGAGGYVFKAGPNGFDTTDIGLANAGAIKAYQLFADLVQKDKLIPQNIQNSSAPGSLFQSGKLGMWIDGDWDIAANKKALGADFAAAALPALPGGSPARPFAGVQVAFVSAYSQYKSQAWSFIKYMLPQISIPDYKVSGRLPALKSALNSAAVTSDPIEAVYAKTAAAGDALPNVPEMSTVWTPAANGIDLVITGKKSPAAAATGIVTAIKQGIAQQQS